MKNRRLSVDLLRFKVLICRNLPLRPYARVVNFYTDDQGRSLLKTYPVSCSLNSTSTTLNFLFVFVLLMTLFSWKYVWVESQNKQFVLFLLAQLYNVWFILRFKDFSAEFYSQCNEQSLTSNTLKRIWAVHYMNVALQNTLYLK